MTDCGGPAAARDQSYPTFATMFTLAKDDQWVSMNEDEGYLAKHVYGHYHHSTSVGVSE